MINNSPAVDKNQHSWRHLPAAMLRYAVISIPPVRCLSRPCASSRTEAVL
jgi:hypothetical protein